MGNNISQYHKKRRISSLSLKKSSTNKEETPPTPVTSSSSESILLNGRKYHGETSSVYWLPNDNQEMDRLIGQHFALKALFGGNLPIEADEFLDLEKGAQILDLGCGPGTWIMDMATEFPNSQFTGIDMSDVFPSNIRPANVSFKLANVLDGLPFEDNTFDLVNFSMFILALKKNQWAPVMNEVRRVLKPGGLFLSKECSMLLLGNPFVQFTSQVYTERLIEREQEPCVVDKMQEFMTQNGFDVISYAKKPTFPGRSDCLNREFLWDIKHIFNNCQPFLLSPLRVTEEEFPHFLDKLISECQKSPEPRWDMACTLGRKPL
ncbi:S-adenosyl-L-methionine-dependent methyltransferase [Sporodiniella umbellata]|nr:S-adenosyl-L-methionine-dependent methyltransferase [Sporodiniella umbellata]